MALLPKLRDLASKGFRNEPMRKVKDGLRPLKHALVGKEGIYKAIELAQGFEKQVGKEVLTVFDVGAAIGEAAVPMLKAFPRAQVYCFEPLPDSFKKLTERTKKFGDRIHRLHFGLYNADAEQTFYVWDGHHDGSSVIKPPAIQKNHEIKIKTRTLDDVCKELGITHIDFMKIDVEGVEKEMLEGGRHMLPHVDNVFVEISPHRKGFSHDYIDVFEQLHAAGFTFMGMFGDFFFTRLWHPTRD